jgi:hypothetical protein
MIEINKEEDELGNLYSVEKFRKTPIMRIISLLFKNKQYYIEKINGLENLIEVISDDLNNLEWKKNDFESKSKKLEKDLITLKDFLNEINYVLPTEIDKILEKNNTDY